jgi:hypothetical protein
LDGWKLKDNKIRSDDLIDLLSFSEERHILFFSVFHHLEVHTVSYSNDDDDDQGDNHDGVPLEAGLILSFGE